MKRTGDVWIGADPGGMNNFGLAILESNGSAQTWCVNCADEAVDAIAERVSSPPAGVGVDAPLWWSSGRSSDRQADQWLRKKYGLSGGEVQASNSLRGAALVQGAMFVQRVRERFPNVNVTEAHPNALLKALGQNWGEFRRHFAVTTKIENDRKHECDAIIAAVAAREGFEGRWRIDLSTARKPGEQDPLQFWLAPIHYFWPET